MESELFEDEVSSSLEEPSDDVSSALSGAEPVDEAEELACASCILET